MLEKIREFLAPYGDIVGEFIQPVISWLADFFSKDFSIIYVAVALVLLIVFISGLVTCFRKFPKFFMFIVITLSLISVFWYFVMCK